MDLMDSLMGPCRMAAVVGIATFVLLFMFFGSNAAAEGIAITLSIGALRRDRVGLPVSATRGLLDFTPRAPGHQHDPHLAVVFGLHGLRLPCYRIRGTTHDNRAAVARGMQHTGSISAALLFLVVIGAFSTAGITVVKLIGVGMFVAAVVDAVLVRSFGPRHSASWARPTGGCRASRRSPRLHGPPHRSGRGWSRTRCPARLPDEQPYPYAIHWEAPCPRLNRPWRPQALGA